MTSTGDLSLRRRPKAALALGAVLFLGALAVLVGRAAHPAPLPLSDRVVTVTTPVDQPVYVGVFAPGRDFDRTLRLDGVKVHATSSTPLDITPLLCHGGAVGVTTDPQPFCDSLVDPEGESLGAGDSIVLEIVCDAPTVAVIDPVRIGFREGLGWGNSPGGCRDQRPDGRDLTALRPGRSAVRARRPARPRR